MPSLGKKKANMKSWCGNANVIYVSKCARGLAVLRARRNPNWEGGRFRDHIMQEFTIHSSCLQKQLVRAMER